jgi:anti-anti-sigma factor
MATREAESALGVTRVRLTGEIDLSRSDEVDAQLAAAQASAPELLEIDLSSVSFMDSQGLRVLLGAHKRAQSNGHRIVILSPRQTLRRLFEISGVDQILDVVNDEITEQPCPCCSDGLRLSEPRGDGLRPGDRYCQECRWVVVQEVLAGGAWPVACPSHGRFTSKSLS